MRVVSLSLVGALCRGGADSKGFSGYSNPGSGRLRISIGLVENSNTFRLIYKFPNFARAVHFLWPALILI